jgi:transcriptional antiterminator
MALFDDSMEALAEHLNMSRQTLNSKLQCISEFTRDEIAKIIIRYKLTPEDTFEIFSFERSNNEHS